ncbi:MAG TPA: hypothetical protein ENH91_10300 [Leeuwenhoekiella sp.]|nr:hypothetical protein [Leeuwenhoekiella sp.]
MKIQNERGQRMLIVSDQEKKEIEEIRGRFLHYLNIYVITERDEIHSSVSLHITMDAVRHELTNLRHKAIIDLEFNKAYFKTATIEDDGIKIDPDKFLELAIGYNLLDDESKGLRVLQNIIKVRLIEWMIKNEYNPRNDVEVSIISNSTSELQKAKYNHIFINDGLESFDYLNDNFHLADDAPTVKYTLIYDCLRPKIKCTTKAYREFVREYCREGLKGTDFQRLANKDTHSYPDLDKQINELYKAR